MSLRACLALPCFLAASLFFTACSGDGGNKPTDAGAPDASSKEPVVGGKLGAVIASAAAGSTAAPKAKSKDPNEPPENGIFAAGEADLRQAKTAPPKIDILSEGADPKINLTYKLTAAEQKVSVTVGMRMGQGARLPTVTFDLSIKPEKAKDDKPKEGTPAPPARLAATVTGVGVPPAQPLPKELGEAIGKLKGTVVRWDLSPTGAASNYAVEAPKDAAAGLELILDALVDTLSTSTLVTPGKPIGKDGYWIVADRAKTAVGLDVVRFRVFKILSVDNGNVTLSVDIRQYSADPVLKLDSGAGQKQEMPMEMFESQGKGQIVWNADTFLPNSGEVKEGVGAKLAGGQGGRSAVVQTELTGQIAPTAAPAKKP